MAGTNVYKDFWQDKTTPLHRFNDEHTYEAYGNELRNIFNYYGYKNGPVLEIGCGNGALFPYFDFDHSKYKGIDISKSLLGIFKEKYPLLDISLADGSEYKVSKKFDLIFGNAVHQNFNREMLANHFVEIKDAITENGFIVLANLPYKYLEMEYYCGELGGKINYPSKLERFINRVKKVLLSFRKRFNGIGFWYSANEIQLMLGKDYKIDLLGSNFYPYRVHLIIRKSNNERKLS